jgi:CDP-paratose 2-epimerase
MSETRWGDVKLYISDNVRFEKLSGWRPKRDIETIMGDIHEWLITNKDMLAPIFAT